MHRYPLLVLAVALGLAACGQKDPAATTAPAASPAAALPPNAGRVLQVQQAAGYTYAEVELGDGRRAWVAGGPIQVKAGDTVQWSDYTIMENFHARSLNRTFAQILFVNAWGPLGGNAVGVAPHGVPPAGRAMPMPMAQHPAAMGDGGAGASPEMHQGIVRSVKSSGDYTYVEIDRNGATVWVDAAQTAVKAGDRVRWNGMVMRDFESKALGRRFDQIVFADRFEVLR